MLEDYGEVCGFSLYFILGNTSPNKYNYFSSSSTQQLSNVDTNNVDDNNNNTTSIQITKVTDMTTGNIITTTT